MTVVTRFAPSPTGYLHIGGARTALFNWLYARHMGGKFLLRIEDTDKERNTPEAVQAIFEGLDWLGLKGDDVPVFQSTRATRHAEVARELVARGHAYLDYTTQEEIDEARAIWIEQGGNKFSFRFKSPYRDQPASGPYALRPHTIRFKAPVDTAMTLKDLVQGPVTWSEQIDDFVLLRSDGSPTYMLAVVVDDHDMGVTHVIRGDDHLNNAFRQIPLYWAMGWQVPQYAHIPLIHDHQGKKLSKRTGAAAVEQYRDDFGLLPDAMLNYLAKLGWGHGDDELFTMEQAIEWFDIVNVGRNPARLDAKRMASISGHYIRHTADEVLFAEVAKRLNDQDTKFSLTTLAKAIPGLKERSADLNALTQGTMYLWASRPIQLAVELTADDKAILSEAYHYLGSCLWNHDSLHEALNKLADDLQVKLGKVVGPVRVALTGTKISPPINDVMALLGRNDTLARIRDAL